MSLDCCEIQHIGIALGNYFPHSALRRHNAYVRRRGSIEITSSEVYDVKTETLIVFARTTNPSVSGHSTSHGRIAPPREVRDKGKPGESRRRKATRLPRGEVVELPSDCSAPGQSSRRTAP
jgi:hypothetical protein